MEHHQLVSQGHHPPATLAPILVMIWSSLSTRPLLALYDLELTQISKRLSLSPFCSALTALILCEAQKYSLNIKPTISHDNDDTQAWLATLGFGSANLRNGTFPILPPEGFRVHLFSAWMAWAPARAERRCVPREQCARSCVWWVSLLPPPLLPNPRMCAAGSRVRVGPHPARSRVGVLLFTLYSLHCLTVQP